MKTAFIIDGFNFYHSIEKLPKFTRWIDYKKLCSILLDQGDECISITYCTAIATYRKNDSITRHINFIEACKINGIKIIEGKFKKKIWKCKKCHKDNDHHEEKRTDVNVALTAYRIAAKGLADKVIIVSGDTDMIPAIQAIKADFPNVQIGIATPLNRHNNEIAREASFVKTIKEILIYRCILPKCLTGIKGNKVYCPQYWLNDCPDDKKKFLPQ